jgi:phospholipase D1/2
MAASLLQLDHNCCAIEHADRVAFLVDGEEYFDAFMLAAQRAQRSIIILAWDFNSRTPLRFGDDGKPALLLGDFLNGLAKRNRALQIWILDWDYPMIFGTDREFPPIYGISWKPHKRVHFRYDNTHPTAGSHHQKIVSIDGELAFVGGLDLTSKRWDTRKHGAADPRRALDGVGYPPFHDMMIAVDGAAATAIDGIARRRWESATQQAIAPVSVAADPWPQELEAQMTDVNVGIACTAPAAGGRDGVRNIEQLYLDMIARARHYIYIENQYFTAKSIGEALAARLAEPDPPEVVLVTRLLSHGWLEEITMHVLRTRLIRMLRAADHKHRFEVYYPHVDGLKEGTCVDVHSKVMVVDDEWLRIGSSNISNRSMGMDTECDVVVEAGGDPGDMQAIRSFRDNAIAEHAGVELADVTREIEAKGGMIAAIAQLGTPARKLMPLGELPDYSDTLIDAMSITDPERPVSLDLLNSEFQGDSPQQKRRLPWTKIAMAIVTVIALTLAWRYTPLSGWVSVDKVTDFAGQYSGLWWTPILLILLYTPASLIMFPRPILTLTAVILFGPWLGSGYAMIGILLAATTHYYAGRLFKRDTVRRLAGGRLNRITEIMRNHGVAAVTAIRLTPIAPFFVPGLIAGAIHIKLWQFLLGTFFGMLPGALVTTVFADQFQAAIKDGHVNYWVVAGVIVFFATMFIGVRRWFKRLDGKGKSTSTSSPQRRKGAKETQRKANSESAPALGQRWESAGPHAH